MSVRLHGCERRRAAFGMRLAAVVVVGLALGGMLSGTAGYELIPAALAALLVALAWSITATVKGPQADAERPGRVGQAGRPDRHAGLTGPLSLDLDTAAHPNRGCVIRE